jgi:D-arabinonate dehydratase
MKITNVRGFTVKISLDRPVSFPGVLVTSRDVAFAVVETDAGLRGVGYTFARGGDVAGAVEKNLKDFMVGEDPMLIEKLWEKLYYGTMFLGRKGLMMRALSAADIALWDLKGQIAGLPLYRLLGGYRDSVPAMMAGGFYAEGKGLDTLATEVCRYVDQGFKAIKIVFGALQFRQDLERLKVVRDAVGPDVELMVDLHWSWKEAKTALRLTHQLETYQVSFIEDPFKPDNLRALSQFTAASETPVAAGEMECGRWAFREFLTENAADILRCDATVAGGISEWIKIASMAAAWEVPVIPHYFPDIHVHLVAATANTKAVEFIAPESVDFHKILLEPLPMREGMIAVPQEPGLGIKWNWKAIEQYKI